MTNNDDDPRRNRPEDNPFIAFRRFADSQVSSLLNTVFTLPATIANFGNAHHAREQCLFGKADQSQCEKLRNIEEHIARIRSEGRELYKVGDVQEVLKKGQELMTLDRQADELRKDIVEASRRREIDGHDSRKQTELVERVGNEKGQQWGWSWSWGFPRPFDEEDTSPEDRHHGGRMCRRWRRWHDEDVQQQAEDEWEQFNARWEEIKKRMVEEQPRVEHGGPRVWRWSWSWPPPADSSHRDTSSNDRPANLFDELGDMIVDEATRIMGPPSRLRDFAFQDDAYNPRALEQDERLKKAGVQWRDAFEDLYRADNGAPLIYSHELGQTRNMPYNQWVRRFWDNSIFSQAQAARQAQNEYPKRVPWQDEDASDEPSYEYGHDHEDQHDEPPTPRLGQGKATSNIPRTELDAYERLLGPASPSEELTKESQSSILSTLTTTERTVALDGTVTTKVVLKKRFADGREESSETVHTQRGQEEEYQQQDPWKAMQEAQFPSTPKQKESEKKKGWFWSN